MGKMRCPLEVECHTLKCRSLKVFKLEAKIVNVTLSG